MCFSPSEMFGQGVRNPGWLLSLLGASPVTCTQQNADHWSCVVLHNLHPAPGHHLGRWSLTSKLSTTVTWPWLAQHPLVWQYTGSSLGQCCFPHKTSMLLNSTCSVSSSPTDSVGFRPQSFQTTVGHLISCLLSSRSKKCQRSELQDL